jgi:hypothetical protein
MSDYVPADVVRGPVSSPAPSARLFASLFWDPIRSVETHLVVVRHELTSVLREPLRACSDAWQCDGLSRRKLGY